MTTNVSRGTGAAHALLWLVSCATFGGCGGRALDSSPSSTPRDDAGLGAIGDGGAPGHAPPRGSSADASAGTGDATAPEYDEATALCIAFRVASYRCVAPAGDTAPGCIDALRTGCATRPPRWSKRFFEAAGDCLTEGLGCYQGTRCIDDAMSQIPLALTRAEEDLRDRFCTSCKAAGPDCATQFYASGDATYPNGPGVVALSWDDALVTEWSEACVTAVGDCVTAFETCLADAQYAQYAPWPLVCRTKPADR